MQVWDSIQVCTSVWSKCSRRDSNWACSQVQISHIRLISITVSHFIDCFLGGDYCDFECVFGSFNQVERANGKCGCRNGSCSFTQPKAECAPKHHQYCRTPGAKVKDHPNVSNFFTLYLKKVFRAQSHVNQWRKCHYWEKAHLSVLKLIKNVG